MSYRIASIDVHKKILAVVVGDAANGGEYDFERRKFATTPEHLRQLAEWLIQQQVQEVVMESTAQYWQPVWAALEQHWQPKCPRNSPRAGRLHLAQAKSNRAPRGRKNDFADGERLLKRLVAQELVLSFVPDPEQRLWRTVTRRKNQLTQDRVRLQNQLEALLEQAHIKLSSLVSDLLGVSARMMLQALANGERDANRIAGLADRNLHATREQLADALNPCSELHPVFRVLLKMILEHLQLLDTQMEDLDRQAALLLAEHQQAVQRLAEIPGLRVHAAQQIIAEVGPEAAVFPSEKHLCSWVGVCPGEQISAGQNSSSSSPKGNRTMRHILNQAAHAAVKAKGSIFELQFRKLKPRLGYKQAIGAIAHRLCRLVWKVLHDGVPYEERGPAVSEQSKRVRTSRMVRQLRKLGYVVAPPLPTPALLEGGFQP